MAEIGYDLGDNCEAEMQQLRFHLKDPDLRHCVLEYICALRSWLHNDVFQKGMPRKQHMPSKVPVSPPWQCNDDKATFINSTYPKVNQACSKKNKERCSSRQRQSSTGDGSCSSTEAVSSEGINSSDASGADPHLAKQFDHRLKQLGMVKSRPEYVSVQAAVHGRTGTPSPTLRISNRGFELERQLWHRCLHNCAAQLEGRMPGSSSANAKHKKDEEREAIALKRAARLLEKVHFRRGMPFENSHSLVQSISESMRESWAEARLSTCSCSLIDPAQGAVIVDCCNTLPVLVAQPLDTVLGQDLSSFQHGRSLPSEDTQRGIARVLAGQSNTFVCTFHSMRGGSHPFLHLLRISNVWIPVGGYNKRFSLGIHADVSQLYMQQDHMRTFEELVSLNLSESFMQWQFRNSESIEQVEMRFRL